MKHSDSHVSVKNNKNDSVRMAVTDSNCGLHTRLCFYANQANTADIANANLDEEDVRDLRDLLNKRLGTGSFEVADERVKQLSERVQEQAAQIVQDGARIEELVGKLGRQREDLEQKFVGQVMEYHQGCDDGKREFLRSIGLKPPSVEYMVTFMFQACGDEGDVITEIQRNIADGYSVNDGIEGFEVLNVEARLY